MNRASRSVGKGRRRGKAKNPTLERELVDSVKKLVALTGREVENIPNEANKVNEQRRIRRRIRIRVALVIVLIAVFFLDEDR